MNGRAKKTRKEPSRRTKGRTTRQARAAAQRHPPAQEGEEEKEGVREGVRKVFVGALGAVHKGLTPLSHTVSRSTKMS